MKHPKILVDQSVLRQYRKQAIDSYPKECMSHLWGKIDGMKIAIHVVSPLEPYWQKKDDVRVKSSVLDEDREAARDEGLTVLGSIHSHPDWTDASPSEGDWVDAQDQGDLIMGICSVHKAKRRLVTRIKFYLAQKLPKVKVCNK